jgi:hypothetical protein
VVKGFGTRQDIPVPYRRRLRMSDLRCE